jgi:sulfofructose kinase
MIPVDPSRTIDAVGLGLAVRDLTVHLDAFPLPDSKARAREFSESGGGPVPTALVTMSRLGSRTAFAGVVGEDSAGAFLVEDLRRESVDVSALFARKGLITPASVILVEKEGRRTVCEWRQNDLPFSEEAMERLRPILDRARLLIVDARMIDAQVEAALRIRSAGGLVMLDCGHPRPGVEEILRETDVAILSHTYAREIGAGRLDAETFLRRIVPSMAPGGPRIAVVTLGAEGCLLLFRGKATRVPGHRVEAIDTTGAGDVFHGAFAHAWLRRGEPESAARFANAAAAMKCRGLTGRARIPTEREIRALADSAP